MSDDLRRALHDAVRLDAPHVERMTLAAAIVSTALERAGMRATLVGGGAIEFYIPASYATSDIDLVVERGTRERFAEVFASLGLARRDRHWVLDDLFLEVPGTWMSDPVLEMEIDSYSLQIVRKEVVLADRIVGFRYWKVWS